mmetsp:Transcript_14449/g.22287  ORF Transcript_14449/g.22287 Transcript_14449/m.22287 type:complete len:439 (-) Transcript_14449:147-1463(-)
MNPNFGYGGYQLPPGFGGYAQPQASAATAQNGPSTQQTAGATVNVGVAAPPTAASMMPGVMPNMMMTDAAAAAYMAGVPSSSVVNPAAEKKAKLHYCTIHPEGMPRAFDVPFVERRLPVCDRCKKNFKSRDLCRKRDGHKALPWQMTYVVVTMDSSVIQEDDNGNVSLQNIPMVCELQDTPHMCLGPADGSMKTEPICKVCREKNYTRDYCRNTCKHTTPPWSTTYVKLVADTKPKDDDRFMQYSAKKRKARQEDGVNGKPKPQEDGTTVDEDSDDLATVHKSRTFLCSISSTKLTARWCERIQYPAKSNSTATATSKIESGDDSTPAPPFSFGAPGTPAQANNAQLWDAFRAGAMWAQSQGAQASLPSVMPPGYPFGNPTGAPPMFNGNNDQSSWGAYGQAGQLVDPGEGPSLKKAKADNGDGSPAGLEGGNNNVQI